MALPLIINYYVSQVMGGHGDFNGKLRKFSLTEAITFACEANEENVDCMIYECLEYKYKIAPRSKDSDI